MSDGLQFTLTPVVLEMNCSFIILYILLLGYCCQSTLTVLLIWWIVLVTLVAEFRPHVKDTLTAVGKSICTRVQQIYLDRRGKLLQR